MGSLATSPPACKDKAWEYNEDWDVHVNTFGRFLVAVTYSMGGYTGGAHPFEGQKLEIYDLRNGKVVYDREADTPHTEP